MNKVQPNPQKYITLRGTLPYAYGDTTPRVVLSRALYLIDRTRPNVLFNKAFSSEWLARNKNSILFACKEKRTDNVIVNLPFQKIFLSDALKQNYIIVKKNKDVILRSGNVKYINTDSFAKDFAREIALTLSVGLIKTLFDTLRLGFNFQMALTCAFILGIVKGTVKSVCDILSSKKGSIANMPFKCTLEISAEIATAIVRHFSGLDWHPAPKSALKASFRYYFKHIALGTTILITKTELNFEMFKAALKGILRATFRALLLHFMPPVGQILGPMIGSIIGALYINIFIDQCSL